MLDSDLGPDPDLSYIENLGGGAIDVINDILVPVIFALAFIVFLYGIALKYIFSRGDATKVAEGHRLILWGLIGFAVMLSIWGLVNILAGTFGLDFIGPPTDLPEGPGTTP